MGGERLATDSRIWETFGLGIVEQLHVLYLFQVATREINYGSRKGDTISSKV